jgi:hypothetical protein
LKRSSCLRWDCDCSHDRLYILHFNSEGLSHRTLSHSAHYLIATIIGILE